MLLQKQPANLYFSDERILKPIPQLYEVWLMDNYKKDSLDMLIGIIRPMYLISSLADTASYGNNRFQGGCTSGSTLMIHLLNFTATKITGGSQVVWVTENEANYTNFTVQRSTDGGKTYTVLGGTASNDTRHLQLSGQKPRKRRKHVSPYQIVDLNGTISYSNIVALMYSEYNKHWLKQELLFTQTLHITLLI